MEDCTHKTVFVIDHCPFFGLSSDDPMNKSLWTRCLEAALDYCRIVWDLFPEGKLVRLIASDSVGHFLNSWHWREQNVNPVLKRSIALGAPPPRTGSLPGQYSILNGLRAAIEALTECSEAQLKARLTPGATVDNKCRVICFKSTNDGLDITNMWTQFQLALQEQNEQAAENKHRIPVNFCHLVVIHVVRNTSSEVSELIVGHDISTILSFDAHFHVRANKHLSDKLTNLVLGHYDLASTTVTGIPLKEEENAASINCDVEIFHHANAYTGTLKADIVVLAMAKARETTILKYSNKAKVTPQEMINGTALFRATLADVNSQLSLRLINFLLTEGTVLLETPWRSGRNAYSHLLSARGDKIIIHALKTVLEDPPPLSESSGGREIDYRIADCGALMQANNSMKSCLNAKLNPHNTPTAKMKARKERQTLNWPTITVTLNLHQHIDPLPQIIAKNELTSDDVVQCRQVLYNLAGLQCKHGSLVLACSGVRGKVPKEEETFKQMWTDLEKLVRLNCRTVNHKQVLFSLIGLQGKNPGNNVYMDVQESGAESPNRATGIRATTDSPMRPPPAAKAGSSRHGTKNSAPRTVLDIDLE